MGWHVHIRGRVFHQLRGSGNSLPVSAATAKSAFAIFSFYAATLLFHSLGGAYSAAYLALSICLAATLALLSAIDLETQRLPNPLTLALLAAGLCLALTKAQSIAADRFAAAALAYLIFAGISLGYLKYRGREGLGMGDAKLFAAAGAWLGLSGLPSVLMLSSGSALVAILVAALIGKPVTATTRVPFGPFLAFGFWMTWILGPLQFM